jgi:hypothetical protein
MSKLTITALEELHTCCYSHRERILKEETIGCFFCRNMSNVTDIEEWSGATAHCPKCGVDAVLPGSLCDESVLIEMDNYWFGFATSGNEET